MIEITVRIKNYTGLLTKCELKSAVRDRPQKVLTDADERLKDNPKFRLNDETYNLKNLKDCFENLNDDQIVSVSVEKIPDNDCMTITLTREEYQLYKLLILEKLSVLNNLDSKKAKSFCTKDEKQKLLADLL